MTSPTPQEQQAEQLDALAEQLDDGSGIATAYMRGVAEGLRRAQDLVDQQQETDPK